MFIIIHLMVLTVTCQVVFTISGLSASALHVRLSESYDVQCSGVSYVQASSVSGLLKCII